MSGPKYSMALIEEMKREKMELERQRKIEQERAELAQLRSRLRGHINKIQELKAQLHNVIHTDHMINETRSDLEVLLNELEEKKFDFNGNKNSLNQQIPKAIALYNSVNEKFKTYQHKHIELHVVEHIETSKLTQEKRKLRVSLEKKADLSGYYEFAESIASEIEILPTDRSMIEKEMEQYRDLVDHSKESDIKQLDDKKKYISVMVFNAKKRYRKFSELYDEMIIYADRLQKKVPKLEEYTSIKDLEKQVKEYKCEVEKLDSLEYISDSIEEVMNQYGHKIIRSDVMKKSPDDSNLIQNNLFEINENNAINVLVSQNGAMVMEVVSIGEEAEFTEREKKNNVAEMHKFCDQYPEIIEELGQRGIVFSNRHEMPAEQQFAKKLVVSDRQTKKKSVKQSSRRRQNGQKQFGKSL